jgi:hypothetical protein
VAKVGSALVWCECAEKCADPSPSGLDGSFVGFSPKRVARHEALPGRHIREIAEPQPVGARGPELAMDLFERASCGLAWHRRLHPFAADDALQPQLPHEAGDRTACHLGALPQQLPPDLPAAIDPKILSMHPQDLPAELGIPLLAARDALRLPGPAGMLMICRRGDRQQARDRLDPLEISMSVDERDHLLNGRVSSATAK